MGGVKFIEMGSIKVRLMKDVRKEKARVGYVMDLSNFFFIIVIN